MTEDAEIRSVAKYLFEVGALKRIPRAGWAIAGIKHAESVAEHSHRASVLAAILAIMEGADPARACLFMTFHDTQETRIGDIPLIGRRYVSVAPNEAVTADQVAGCPKIVAAAVRAIVEDYERNDTLEATVAGDADKLECVLQAVEYRQQGYANVQDWIDNCRAALKTESARRIADAAVGMAGHEWRHG
jgi:putative hydrolases of HD superfamily